MMLRSSGGLAKLIYLSVAIAATQPANSLVADLIPPGNKSVTHHLVIVDSPLLQAHRLIAMPVRGFGGFEEIQAGRPFRFSTKYGTRLYVVPSDYVPPQRVSPGEPLPFPSCEVPIASRTYVPRFSPIESLRTTCKLTEVNEDRIQVEVIEHLELGSDAQPVSGWQSTIPLMAIAAAGFTGCLLIRRRTRTIGKAADVATISAT